MRNRAKSVEIEQVAFQPNTRREIDLEVFTMSDLRQRVSAAHLRRHHRYDFHMLVCVKQGHCQPVVDFSQISCHPGSVVSVRPAQVHRFDFESSWDGWILLFRPQLLNSGSDGARFAVDLVETLPTHLALQGRTWRCVADGLARMLADCRLEAPHRLLNQLLQSEVVALVTRLHVLPQDQAHSTDELLPLLERFRTFRSLVDAHFHEWHHVARYAHVMACSERTLARACINAAGIGPKAFIAMRVTLEAKRLLVHTELPVGAVSAKVGFDQATNFVKFFRGAEGCTPGEFRRRQAGAAG
jgi:AraC-like DNA-binding protein